MTTQSSEGHLALCLHSQYQKELILYVLCSQGTLVLFQHPSADSMQVSAAQELSKSNKGSLSAPLDGEEHRLDAVGRKAYYSTSLGLQMANYQDVMFRYNYPLGLLDFHLSLYIVVLFSSPNPMFTKASPTCTP